MPESRDRLSRPDDVREMFLRRRQSIGGITILFDEPEASAGTPFRWGATTMTGTRGPIGVAATRGGGGGGGGGRGSLAAPRTRNRRGRNSYGSPVVGRENMAAGRVQRGRGRGRSTNSLLPSWYPRTPLRDITAVVRAIERRRASLREREGQQIESPLPHQNQTVPEPSVLISDAQLELDISMISPNPALGTKPCPPSVGNVPKILFDITNRGDGEADSLTPQKKLLNSIDTVEKAVMEELRKLKRTPGAKKAGRENKVRTLMSMR